MNEIFQIVKSQDPKYDYVVYLTDGEDIFQYLSEIENEITNLKNNCQRNDRVLFDLLLYSSNTSKRFLYGEIINNHFDDSLFEFIFISKKDTIRKNSLNFFIKNKKFIENSGILSSIQKKIILKGIPI